MKKLLCLLLALALLMSGALAEGDTQTVDLSSYLIVLHTNDLAGDRLRISFRQRAAHQQRESQQQTK